MVVPAVKVGCDSPSRRRSTAFERPATSGAPHVSQATAGPLATTRRPAASRAPSTARSRVTAASGQEVTQAPQAVQRPGSTLRRSDPAPFRSARSAPVEQMPTQTSQNEQPAGSMVTTPSEQPGPSARHGVRPGPSAPKAASDRMVASGSHSSIQSPPGAKAVGTGSWSASTSPPAPRPSAKASTPPRSRTNCSRSATRVSQYSSSQPMTLTPAPAPTSWRSHPAVTISIDGTRSTSHGSPTRGTDFECWQAIATPVADPRRRIAATRTAAAALSPSTSAPGSAKAPLRQAATHTPQPLQRSPSTTTRRASRRNAPCGQPSKQGVQATPPEQRSCRQVATKRRAVLTLCSRDRRDTPPADRLVRSFTGASRSAPTTRATAALKRATDCSRATFSVQPSAVCKSTTTVPAAGTPARRKCASNSPRRCEAARQPTTTRLGLVDASASTRACGASQIS